MPTVPFRFGPQRWHLMASTHWFVRWRHPICVLRSCGADWNEPRSSTFRPSRFTRPPFSLRSGARARRGRWASKRATRTSVTLSKSTRRLGNPMLPPRAQIFAPAAARNGRPTARPLSCTLWSTIFAGADGTGRATARRRYSGHRSMLTTAMNWCCSVPPGVYPFAAVARKTGSCKRSRSPVRSNFRPSGGR